MSDTQKLEKDIRDAEKASNILSDLKNIRAFERVAEYLDKHALNCDPDNKEKAQRIILSKQILASIERELLKIVKDGKTAKITINQIEESSTMREKIRAIRR